MKKIGILVVAYNAASTLAQVLDRIPAEMRGQIHEVPDLTWMSAVGMQGAHAILDDLAATFGVDPAR